MERGLYIVPTPIGNLADITQRALDVLGRVSVIAAEDTRHFGHLLGHYGIDTPTTGYHEHSAARVALQLCERMQAGEAVALVSDAGTPLVSDPGYQLVRAAQSMQIPVVPLPGPCAAITALSACGLSTARFYFEGFLPNRSAARRKRLEALTALQATLVFYEAPHRIIESLTDMTTVFGGDREAAVCRELTKRFETIRRDSLGALLQWADSDINQQRGELVLLVEGATAESRAVIDAQRLLFRLAEELPPRRAASIVAELTGEKARSLYQQLLERSGR